MDYAKVRGFNYQPSYGSTSFENWLYYNADIAELELRRGKNYFPGFNTVRYWLSWQAYLRNPETFLARFEKGLDTANKLGLKVVVCLFNRWHCKTLDNGGVYIDHFVPGLGEVYNVDNFTRYINDVVGSHAGDPRILVWDICNEPFQYGAPVSEVAWLEEIEYGWLASIYHQIRRLDSIIPAGVSIHPMHGHQGIVRIEPISDVLLVHPYFLEPLEDNEAKVRFEQLVEDYKNVSIQSQKPILVTETCWGALDDAYRVEIIKYTLGILNKYEMGFLAHALHYSKVADLHNKEDGPVGWPENLAFINKDGSLRAGHDIFNAF